MISCRIKDADGLVDGKPVRSLKSEEILKRRPDGKGPLGMSLREWRLLTNLKVLFRAYELRDLRAAQDAAKILVDYLEVDPPKRASSGYSGPNRLWKELADGLANDTIDSGFRLSGMINSLLLGIRPVAYITPSFKAQESLSRPDTPMWGMLCPSIASAVAFKLLCNGIRVCLRSGCNLLFVGGVHQDYCSYTHREVHRVNRWRAQKAAQGKNMKFLERSAHL